MRLRKTCRKVTKRRLSPRMDPINTRIKATDKGHTIPVILTVRKPPEGIVHSNHFVSEQRRERNDYKQQDGNNPRAMIRRYRPCIWCQGIDNLESATRTTGAHLIMKGKCNDCHDEEQAQHAKSRDLVLAFPFRWFEGQMCLDLIHVVLPPRHLHTLVM